MTDLHEGLKALGEGSTTYAFDRPNPELLEKFPNPSASTDSVGVQKIDISAPEFTSLCPKTGQPDFAEIIISYVPREFCVESKSLKLYLNGYRNFGEFHEACVDRIGNDLVRLLDPHSMQVMGKFNPRGGIKFWPTFIYNRKQVITEAPPGVLG